MATTAQAQTTPTATDPVQRRLACGGACPQLDAKMTGSPAPSSPASSSEAHPITINPIPAPIPNPQSPTPEHRTRANRANARLSTGPRTEAGKQRSSLNALRHGLTARTAVLPTEDPEAYQRHIQQFLDEYAPATPTETQLVHEIANTAWRLNRIPFLEAELLDATQTMPPNPQSLIPQLATLELHGSRLSRQFQKALDQLRDVQEDRRRLERRHLNEVAELLIRHQRKGLPWDPEGFSKEAGFVFSKEQIERHAQRLIHLNPAYYAAGPSSQADPPPTGAAF
jgi:hypothetical protein